MKKCKKKKYFFRKTGKMFAIMYLIPPSPFATKFCYIFQYLVFLYGEFSRRCALIKRNALLLNVIVAEIFYRCYHQCFHCF